MSLQTPVAFFIFNRADLASEVFARIRDARPQTLLVIADGARPHVRGEAELCAQTRQVVEKIDWPCRLLTNFSEENLGCRARMSSGIDWVFSQVEEAIILEDDCLPGADFFTYCAELLIRYRDDERVMMISGHISHFGRCRSDASYYFGRLPLIWGWATWRRAWRHYDVNASAWPSVVAGEWLKDIFHDDKAVAYWQDIMDRTYRKQIDTWDYQWMLACWLQSGLCVSPTANLVSNIGFRSDATHTTGVSRFAALPTERIKQPLVHPKHVVCDEELSRLTQRSFHAPPDLRTRLKKRFRHLFRH